MLTYSGIRIACSGTIIALTMMRKTAVEARKRSLAKAKPAGRPTARMIAIDDAHTIVELRISWPTGMTEVRPLQLSHENPPEPRNCDSDSRLSPIMTQKG